MILKYFQPCDAWNILVTELKDMAGVLRNSIKLGQVSKSRGAGVANSSPELDFKFTTGYSINFTACSEGASALF